MASVTVDLEAESGKKKKKKSKSKSKSPRPCFPGGGFAEASPAVRQWLCCDSRPGQLLASFGMI